MRWIDDQPFDPKFPFWTRANVGEVLPLAPSPLGWDLLFDAACRPGWRDCMIQRLGIDEDEVDVRNPEVIGVFGGYAYLCATMLRVRADRTPGFTAEALDAAYFGDHPDVPSFVSEPWHDNPRTTEVMTGWLVWVMGTMEQDELEADRVLSLQIRANRPDLRNATPHELLERARDLQPVARRLFDQHINQSGAASIGPGVLGAICAAIGRPEAPLALFAGLGGVDSAAPSYAMWSLSRLVNDAAALEWAFDEGIDGLHQRLVDRAQADTDDASFVDRFDEFLADFGSRGPNEWDISSDVWETKPDIALAAVDRMRLAPSSSAPRLQTDEREKERLTLSAEIESVLAGTPELLGQFHAALVSAATYVPGRERSKTSIIRVVGEMRLAMWELGRRSVEQGEMVKPSDICMLFCDELESLVEGTLTGVCELVAERLAHHEWLTSLEPPFIINGKPAPNTEWPRRGADEIAANVVGDVLHGMPGCPGVVRGIARVVLDAGDPGALGAGEILVAPMTDSAWTPLFVAAAGVVVDVGAALSHAIIVSRELGIPCVVSVTGGTSRIPDGAVIEVDGAAGTVTIVG
ncbi:MAG: PEP-utilizing enzyme [Actinomycetota bacterium]|nr:PEP-utilizing enzyme [Actinomycetota bacterium]